MAAGRAVSYLIAEGSRKRDRAVRYGRALERAMKARGVGSHTVADALGMSRSSITNWRNGRVLPRLETARRLAVALEAPRLETLAAELRRRACLVDGVEFIDDSGSDNRLYCSPGCQDVAQKGRVGVDRRARAAIAERRLLAHERAVEAYCRGCEPSGRCITPDCSLRPVSPLPLREALLEGEPVLPKPRNGYRDADADRRRMRGVWARYTPEQRVARIDKAADASISARGLVRKTA